MRILGTRTAILVASLALAARHANAQESPVAELPVEPPVVQRPVPRSSSYLWLPTLHFGFGAHVPLNPPADDPGFAFDVNAGAMYLSYEPSKPVVVPALGYSYDASGTRGGHYATLGSALMFGSVYFGAGVSSRVLLGDSQGSFAAGLRNSIMAHALGTGITLEVGHQWVRTVGENRHDLRVVVAINPISLFLTFVLRSLAR